MRGLVERAYWWWMRRFSSTARVRGIDFVYLSASVGASAATLTRVLTEALDLISVARGGFGELVGSHLRLVVALNTKEGWVLPWARGYVSNFSPPESESAQLLACRLVWAATVIRLSQDAFQAGRTRDMKTIRQVAREAQFRFVKQLPDADRWTQYLSVAFESD